MRAINGRLESIILLDYKEVFGFRPEIKLKTNHWLLFPFCVHWAVLFVLRNTFLSCCKFSFLSRSALVTKLTVIRATK